MAKSPNQGLAFTSKVIPSAFIQHLMCLCSVAMIGKIGNAEISPCVSSSSIQWNGEWYSVESYTLLKHICIRTLGRWCLKRTAGEDPVGAFPSFLSSSSLGEAGPAWEPHEVTGR